MLPYHIRNQKGSYLIQTAALKGGVKRPSEGRDWCLDALSLSATEHFSTMDKATFSQFQLDHSGPTVAATTLNYTPI